MGLQQRVMIGAGIILFVSSIVVGVPQTAEALDGGHFDPGYIISDAQFYAGDSMSEEAIQAFLNSVGPASCRPGYVCLKDLRFDTFTKISNPMCSTYSGAAGESVARIIAKVSHACGISPKVLLVMLQKEQGLITDDWPTAGQLRAAMGAGCPDTAACDPDQAGFYQQVYLAAYYLIRYGGPPGTGPGTDYTSDFSYYGPGKTVPIQYNPNASCGTKNVYIRNQPTASLYTYTPYTPNAAALANLGGTGDGCSSYGNRNFWTLYNNWFGDPTAGLEGVTVSRIAGADRYAVAISISQASYPTPGIPVVYVTTGAKYPDALSAAPAATLQGGPLLLTPPDQLPNSVRDEVVRLAPAKVIVVGGPMSVSDDVYNALATIVGVDKIERLGGADRYEASRNIVEYAFGAGGATTAYIATGLNFPDALSASGAGGALGVPVILVRGTDTEVDAPTAELLARLGVTQIKVAGGPNSVTPQFFESLELIAPTTRLSGGDRFEASKNIASDGFAGLNPTEAFIATGFNFPDALAGAALAGSKGAPLIVVQPDCIPQATIDYIKSLHLTEVTLLGGVNSLSMRVQYFIHC